MPEYQHILSYFEFIGKERPNSLYSKGIIQTIIALINGKASKIIKAITIAIPLVSILKIDAPKYAKTNASEI